MNELVVCGFFFIFVMLIGIAFFLAIASFTKFRR